MLQTQSVHPRLRGELRSRPFSEKASGGSSPLARGTPGFQFRVPAGNRFIPACAGNSPCLSRYFPCTAVHPRLRGELESCKNKNVGIAGSSPLARGTLGSLIFHIVFLRFIPACAGNSASELLVTLIHPVHPRLRGELIRMRPSNILWAVHPRLRGELDNCFPNRTTGVGSSPLARGTHLKWLQHYTNRLTAKLLKNISKQE